MTLLLLFFVLCGSLSLSSASADDLQWKTVANQMWDQRWAPAYTLLPDGHTGLIVGGYSFAGGGCVNSADIFDEHTQRFVLCKGHLDLPRDFAIATPLHDGTVLISGGFNDVFGSVSIAELYHPDSQLFSVISQHMLSPRELHTATLLNDGTVLIAGGLDLWIHRTQNTAEIFDPKTQTFTATIGNMTKDRFGQAACLLNDGRVLIVGGTSVLFGRNGYSNVLATAEIYNPATGLFTPTSVPMSIGRDRPTANLLANGTVLIAGGQGPNGASIDYSEIYDPKTDQFTKVIDTQNVPRMAHCTGVLPDGQLILTGGWSAPIKATTDIVEEFNQYTEQFIKESSLPFSSHDAAQIVFPDGEVLVAGGKTVTSNGSADGISAGAWATP